MKTKLTQSKTSYLEREMNRLSDLYDTTLINLTPIPTPDEMGMIRIHSQDLRKLMGERRKLTYAFGFFYGISCLMYDQKEKARK